jgi:hypothetical protein
VHEQIFISGVWHSGTSLVAEIAKLNGYDLGRILNDRNDNNYAWRGDKGCIRTAANKKSIDHDPESLKGILNRGWPFDTVDEEENKLFKKHIIESRNKLNSPEHNCCKVPGLLLMTPHIQQAFPESPIIHVVRNPIDVSLSQTDNYFLNALTHDKISRPRQKWETSPSDIINNLFEALGDLEWKDVVVHTDSIRIGHNRKHLLWNLLYTIRWVMMIDRLTIDLDKHKIQNHHIIRFEKIVLKDKQEIAKLKDILGVSGDLKLPEMNISKIKKYQDYITVMRDSPNGLDPVAKHHLNRMYWLSKTYLEEFGYAHVVQFMEKQDFISA